MIKLVTVAAATVVALSSSAFGAAAPKAPVLKVAAPPSKPFKDGETPAWAKPYLGAWSLYEDGEGGAVCGVKFISGMSIGGAPVEVSATCRRNFPMEDVTAWYPGNEKNGRKSITLIDAQRHPVLKLEPGPDKLWQGTLPGDRSMILERGAPDAPKSLRALFTDESFNLSGPNNAESCGFSVTPTSATAGTLEQTGGCAERFKGQGWAKWSFTDGKLKLLDKKGAVLMILSRADPSTFQADVARDMPVFFGPGTIDGSCLLTKDC